MNRRPTHEEFLASQRGDAPRGAPAREASAEDIRARAQGHEARNPQRPPTPPPDQGRVLARIPRHDGSELRVSLHTFEGKPYARVALWNRGEGDAWWPVKGKGIAVKVRELARVATGLADAMDITADDNPNNRGGGR